MSRFAAFFKSAMVAAVLLAPTAAWAGPYSAIYVFGDSLVDGGNVQALSVGAGGGDPAPESAGYENGRFTNGATWVDLLSEANGTGASDGYLTSAGGDNYAFGGARAVTNGDGAPDLDYQVTTYLTQSGGTADATALYVINIGGNDAFAIASGDTGGLTAEQYTAAMINSIVGEIQTLAQAGATTFLITGIPDVSSPPASNGNEAGARFLSDSLDAALQSALDGLEQVLTGITIYRFDYIDFGDEYLADLNASGTTAITETSCLTGEGPSPTIDCTGYLYFDNIHPTDTVHEAIFYEVAAIVGIPEPASLALFGAGIAGLTIARRRTLPRAA